MKGDSAQKRPHGWRPCWWSAEDDERLIRVWTSDLTVAEIATLFGRGEVAVAQRAKTLRKRGAPIGKRPIVYKAPWMQWEKPVRAVGAIPGVRGRIFTDDPRAVAECGTAPDTLPRPTSFVPTASTAAWATR